jgi:hypothetical protein
LLAPQRNQRKANQKRVDVCISGDMVRQLK